MTKPAQDSINNSNNNNYSLISIVLHWLTALLVFSLFSLGFWMVGLDYYHPWYQPAPELHKSLGICLMALMLFRVFWLIKQGKPKALDSHSLLEKRLSSITHLLLYIIILITLVSGYLITTADGRGIEVFQLFEIPALGELFEKQADRAGVVHEYVAYSLIFLALLHAIAALKHHFIDKDNTLLRMLKKK